MKKRLLPLLLFLLVTFGASAQKGLFSAGAKGAFNTDYKMFTYGLDLSYHTSDALEFSLNSMVNPSFTVKPEYNFGGEVSDQKLAFYSTSLDMRFYLLLQRTWASGPLIGAQYLHVNYKDELDDYNENVLGMNLGWYFRMNLAENITANASWRYVNLKQKYEDMKHHSFMLGVSFTF